MTESQNPIKIVIAGLGTVGKNVIEIIESEQFKTSSKFNASKIIIKAVSARSKKKWLPDHIEYIDNTADIINYPDYDILIELIGGEDGIAYEIIKNALNKGKHVITANKALIAKHGNELAKIADSNNLFFQYEAAVAGGIPVIKTIKESLATNNISKIVAILNGTSNYILSNMELNKENFDIILKKAQNLGYAESDPAFDIDGNDTAHKLSILSAIAYNVKIDYDSISLEGIRNINLADIEYANKLGYSVKSLAVSEKHNNNITNQVFTALVKQEHILSQVKQSLNCVIIYSDYANKTILIGHGAGGKETASSIVSDVIDIYYKNQRPCLGYNLDHIKNEISVDNNQQSSDIDYYLRITLTDKNLTDRNNIMIEQIKSQFGEIKIQDGNNIILLTNNIANLTNLKNNNAINEYKILRIYKD